MARRGGGGDDDERLDPALGIGALSDGAAAGDAQHPQGLDGAVAVLGDTGGAPGLRGAGSGLGVDRIGLAQMASGGPVRAVDLDVRSCREPGGSSSA